MTQLRCPKRLRALRRDRRGTALLEFALILPVVLSLILGGIELGNYIIVNVKVQRLATMLADLVAQSGTAAVGANEPQIYDLFEAMTIAGRPLDVQGRGRVIISAVEGVDSTPTDAAKVADQNKLIWQRFDGSNIAAAPKLGCWSDDEPVTLAGDRQLLLDEIMFHAQVSFRYEPLILGDLMNIIDLPSVFTRTAVFRARNTHFRTPTPAANYPAKDNCDSANGL